MPDRIQIIAGQAFAVAVDCDLRSVRRAVEHCGAFLRRCGLTSAEVETWELMLIEAGNNAARYALEPRRSLPILFQLWVAQKTVEIRITDHTGGFDLGETVALPSPLAEHGRGLFLIKSLADEVQYLRGLHENCLVMRCRRAGNASPGPAPSEAQDMRARWEETEQTLDRMTVELASTYESLSFVLGFSAELANQAQPEAFARQSMKDLLRATQADWYVLRLFQERDHLLRLATSSGGVLLPSWLLVPENAAGMVPLEVRAAMEQKDLWFDSTTPLAPTDPLALLGHPGSGLAHPIVVNGGLLGVLTVGRDRADAPFEAGQVSVIQIFADFLGIQIRNAEFREGQVQNRLTARELEIAAEIQRSLLPRRLPELPGFQIVGHYRSARKVGGDFYDAFLTPEGGLLLAIADVMGKGVPAALFAAVFRSQLHSGAKRSASPGALLTWLNQTLYADLERVDMFITARLVLVDPRQHTVQTSSAGHPPLLMTDAEGRLAELDASNLPLGVRPDTVYGEEIRPLPSGARLLLFTDGVSEARNPAAELLGVVPLKTCLAPPSHGGPPGPGFFGKFHQE